mmetsp:Transcript_2460/g.5111  ORF Transcript_2460/g.5111 Transcript_2460/m.5111 type:complete len:284 (-) Transcript_2460:58-909(-)
MRVDVLQMLGEAGHPLLHVILEVFRQVLVIERVENAADGSQGGQTGSQLGDVVAGREGVQLGVDGLEQLRERFLEAVQHVQNVFVERVAALHVAEPLEDGIGRDENPVDDAPVAVVETRDQIGQQVVPLGRKIRRGDQADGFSQLDLNLGGHRAHQFDQVVLDDVAVLGRHGVLSKFRVGVVVVAVRAAAIWRPALLDHVLEVDRGGLADRAVGGLVGGHEAQHGDAVAGGGLGGEEGVLGMLAGGGVGGEGSGEDVAELVLAQCCCCRHGEGQIAVDDNNER